MVQRLNYSIKNYEIRRASGLPFDYEAQKASLMTV